MVNNQIVCEDIIQNVFLKLYENLNKIVNKESVIFWVYKTARNEVYSYYRKKSLRSNYFESSEFTEELFSNEEVLDDYELKEMKELVSIELNQLPTEQKEIYLLKEYGGLSYKEIAAITEVTEDLIRSRLYKTRQKLIKSLRKVLLRN